MPTNPEPDTKTVRAKLKPSDIEILSGFAFVLVLVASNSLLYQIRLRSQERHKEHLRQVKEEQWHLRSDLWDAAREGNVARFESLVLKVSPSSTDAQNSLRFAAEAGRMGIFKLWLDRGWSTAFFDDDLGSAVCGQHAELVRRLLDRGAHVDFGKGRAVTALSLAAMRKNAAIVAMLLQAGADPNAPDMVRAVSEKDSTFGWTPLMRAARAGNKDVAALLLRYHADVHHASGKGETALSLAKQYNHADVVKLLLQAG